jgi:hypothetical protein
MVNAVNVPGINIYDVEIYDLRFGHFSVVFVSGDAASLLPPPAPVAGAMPRAHHHAMPHCFQFGAIADLARDK